MPIEPGTRLGPYEVLAPAGAGGMGEVYRARDTRLDRIVAVKVLPAHLTAVPEVLQRFEREARAASSLQHPHICTLHDIGTHDDIHFLVMEFLEGETLAARIEKGSLPVSDAMRIAAEIAGALDMAHRRGLIHRDLKPGNIMLTKSGAKLLDFGLAKSTGLTPTLSELTSSPTVSQPLTAQGTIIGTYQYMAPEQFEGKEADARSDIFAFGAMLYEMLAGHRAFHGKSHASLIASILEHEPRPLSEFAPMTPPALDRLVRTCLAKDPDERRQTMHDILLELRWIAEGGSLAGPEASGPAPMAERRRTRERITQVVAALLLIATAALATLTFLRNPVEPRVVRALIPEPEKNNFHSTGTGAGPLTISPDGKRLVFAADDANGRHLLWVRPVDSLEARPLAGTEEAAFPFWSADGGSIGFFADGKLKKIDAAGGSPLTLCDAPAGRGGSWNAQGVIIFAPDVAGPLSRVSAAGGPPAPLTQLDQGKGQLTHRWPHFLPDGNKFLYLARARATGAPEESTALMAGSLDGKPPKLLFRAQGNAVYSSGFLFFVREGTLMAQPFDPRSLEFSGDALPVAQDVQHDGVLGRDLFDISRDGTLAYQTGQARVGSQLIWFDRSGKQLGTLGDLAPYYDLAISPDDQKVAVSISDARIGPQDIWVYEVARGLRTRFTFDPAVDHKPIWSPDGSSFLFASNRGGLMNLYLKTVAGIGAEELLLQTDRVKFPCSWSSDGRFISYEILSVPKTGNDIWVLPMFGDKKPIPFLQSEFNEAQPAFSPDGKWIAYRSDEARKVEVYVAPFPGPGRKWQVSSNGGEFPVWRRDGKEIFYLAPDNKLMAVEVGARGDTFQVGAPKVLFEARPSRPGTVYDVTRDGRRFLVNTTLQQQVSTPITLVVNWSAATNKK